MSDFDPAQRAQAIRARVDADHFVGQDEADVRFLLSWIDELQRQRVPDPAMSETVKAVAEVFPGTRVVLEDDRATQYAWDILHALGGLVKLYKGRTVSKQQLWQDMLGVVAEGLKAMDRTHTL